MIATVTFDPRIELTLGLEGFAPGSRNKARRTQLDVFGKGFDASVELRGMRVPTLCLGISYERDNGLLEDWLERRCIARDFAVAPGNARRIIRLADASKAGATVIEIPADPVPPHIAEGFLKKLEHYAHHCSIIAFCDHPPDNDDLYRLSLELVKSLGVAFRTPAEPILNKEPLELEEMNP